MNRDKLLRQWLPESISLNPIGRNAEEIWIEEFDKIYLQGGIKFSRKLLTTPCWID